MRTHPGDQRYLFKSLIRAAGGALKGLATGGPLGAVVGGISSFVGGGGGGAVPGTGCPSGFSLDSRGNCVPTRSPGVQIPIPGTDLTVRPFDVVPGGDPFIAPRVQVFGDAVVGRFGAGLEPATQATNTRICPRGTVLGVDGLCYNRSAIRNSDRMWPRGRRPLLTGGDMRAISQASTAANKLERKTKQLQDLGMLKKPTVRRIAGKSSGTRACKACS